MERAAPTTRPTVESLLVDLGSFAAIAGGLGVLGLFGLAELLVHLPLPRWLYALVVAVEAVFLLSLRLAGASRARQRVIAAIMTALVALHLLPFCSCKPFHRDLDRVAPGMTYAEVEQLMGSYMKGAGAKWYVAPWGERPPTEPPAGGPLEGTVIYRHSDVWYHDSDWGMVTFADDRVVHVEFSGD